MSRLRSILSIVPRVVDSSEQGPKADGTLRCREQRRTGGKQRLERTPRNKAVVRALAQHCEKRILVQHERDFKAASEPRKSSMQIALGSKFTAAITAWS